MITYHRKRFKGGDGQGSVHQVADLSVENSMTERAQPSVRTVVIGLMAPSQISSSPQPKRSKGRVDPVNASSSEKGLMAPSQVSSGPQPKRSKGRVDPMKASSSAREQSQRPQQSKNRKRVATSSDSEKTTASVSRARRQARRTVRNGRQEEKLDDKVLSEYLGNLWQTIPSEKKDSCAYIDCLWFAMYHKGDREKALKWIRREGIFSKKYVFVPICLSNHWSLLIFCHLGEDLQSKNTTPCMLLLDSLSNADPIRQYGQDIRKFLLDIYEGEGISVSKKQIDKVPLLVPKEKQASKSTTESSTMITYHRKRFKGGDGQGSVHQVADLSVENSMTERAQPSVRTVVIGLMAPSQISSSPQPKRSKGRVDPVNASSSEKGLMAPSQVSSGPQPKRSKGRVDPMKASSSAREQSQRPQQSKNRKRVATSSDSEKTTASVSRARRQARRTVRNGRQEEKLDDKVLSEYLGNLWQTIPSEKKDSCAYIDCLWFAMYHKGDREKALKWIRREGIFSKKYVFVPICLSNHWSLLIFCHLGEDLQSKNTTPCMLLLDSLSNADPIRQYGQDIRKFLLDIYEGEGISVSKKQIDKVPLLVPKVPQQTGNRECGYYVLYYITQFLPGSPETFSISDGYPYFMSEDWFTAKDLESFCKTLPSPDQETSLGNDLSDGASDDIVLIE